MALSASSGVLLTPNSKVRVTPPAAGFKRSFWPPAAQWATQGSESSLEEIHDHRRLYSGDCLRTGRDCPGREPLGPAAFECYWVEPRLTHRRRCERWSTVDRGRRPGARVGRR